MRGSFNNTYDVYYGQTSTAGTPGTSYLVDQPCRVVAQTEIEQVEFPMSLSNSWVTYGGPQFNMPNSVRSHGQVYSVDYGSADVLAIPSGSMPVWTVLRAESLTPIEGFPYLRVLICRTASIPVPIPPPPPPPPPPVPGGFTCATAVAMTLGTELFAESPSVIGASYWYHSAIAAGSYTADLVIPSGLGLDVFIVVGTSCGSVVTVVHVSVSGSYGFAVSSPSNVWLHASASSASVPYQCTIS